MCVGCELTLLFCFLDRIWTHAFVCLVLFERLSFCYCRLQHRSVCTYNISCEYVINEVDLDFSCSSFHFHKIDIHRITCQRADYCEVRCERRDSILSSRECRRLVWYLCVELSTLAILYATQRAQKYKLG